MTGARKQGVAADHPAIGGRGYGRRQIPWRLIGRRHIERRQIGRRLILSLALALLLPSCGDDPTGPNMATVDVAGNWTGTWTFTAAGVAVTDDVTVILNQSDASASGTWTAKSGASGQINLTATAAPSGSLAITMPTLGGGPCTATTTIQGTASSSRLDLNLADITPQGICQWGAGGRFALTR